MKIIEVYRGKSSDPIKLDNRDSYASSLQVYDDDSKVIATSQHVNTTASIGHPGGRLAPLCCYGIYHEMFNYPAFILFNCFVNYKDIKTWDQLTPEQRTFESLVSNPNHNNEPVMTLVDFHIGDRDNTGSDGCITYFPDEWEKFKIFKDNEIIIFKLA